MFFCLLVVIWKASYLVCLCWQSIGGTGDTHAHTYTHDTNALSDYPSDSVSLCFNKSNRDAKLLSAWHNRVTVREKRGEKTSVRETAGKREAEMEGEDGKVQQWGKRMSLKFPVNALSSTVQPYDLFEGSQFRNISLNLLTF